MGHKNKLLMCHSRLEVHKDSPKLEFTLCRVGRFLPYTVKTTVITQFLPWGEIAERGELNLAKLP